MQRSHRQLLQPWLFGSGLALACLGACSGAQFTSSGADAGGRSGTGGGSASGTNATGGSAGGGAAPGSSGDTSMGGAPDGGGSSGSGGSGGVAKVCDCPAGHYCRDGSTDCFDCAEFNRLHFGTPERLATLSEGGQGSRFPRVGTSSSDLVYRFEGMGLRYTTDVSTSAGTTLRDGMAQDSGPLILREEVTTVSLDSGAPSFSFLFDRVVEGTRRALFFGTWSTGRITSEPAPMPFNGGKGDYSIAVALHPTPAGPPRAYWMTLGDPAKKPTLVTALLTKDPSGVAVGLALGDRDCPASDTDLTPWVTADGGALLFSHTAVGANCVAGRGKDLYTTALQPATGLPPAGAVALVMSDVNSPMDDVDPSFSADLCELYFASNRDGKFAVYRARRR